MAGLDPAVRKETGYIAVWEVLLSLLMEAVFLVIRRWELPVLFGNLGGAALAVGNFFLLALTVSKAVEKQKPQEAATRVRATATIRLIGMGGLAALLIGVFHTNVYATLIPLLFPRAAIAVRPLMDRKRGAGKPESEGSDLID